MVKYGDGQTHLKGGNKIETGRDDGSKPEEPKPKRFKKKGVIVDIDEPYLPWREGLMKAPLGCRLWIRPGGKQFVQFPDGSSHRPEEVGFDAESWHSAEYFDTRSQSEQEQDETE